MAHTLALRRLHALSVFTAAMTFLLLVAGALVVGWEAGLAVPDWPLSFGTWMPPMEGGVFYEHGHRMIAGAVGILTTILLLGLWWKESRRWVRWLALVAWIGVLVQAVLGGITVLYRLPMPVLIAHAFVAQAFFCLTLCLAVFTSAAWNRPCEAAEDTQFPSFRQLCTLATGALLVQLVLGAALRHKALGVGPHLIWAGITSLIIAAVCFQAVTEWDTHADLRKLAKAAGALAVLQVLLGLASHLLRTWFQVFISPHAAVVVTTTAHVVIGALLLGATLILTLLAYRRTVAVKARSFARRQQNTLAGRIA